MWEKIRRYMSFIKIEHTIFSLPVIFAGSVLAGVNNITIRDIVLIFLAGFSARAFALSINRIIDKNIDAKNPRTKNRELPSKKIKLIEAILISIISLGIYFLSAYMLCKICFWLSPIPIIAFTVYPYMKRFTYFCHFGVGFSLALAPLGGYVAIKKDLCGILPVIFLALFTFFWVSGFDIIYAILDEEFDKAYKIYSIPAAFGRKKALFISSILHILAGSMLIALFSFLKVNVFTLIFLGVVLFLLFLEHKKAYDIDFAFFRVNAVLGIFVFLYVFFGVI